MKLIHSKAELLKQPSGLEGVYKAIELAGRTCYKSEDKITEDSAKDFVERMIKSGHTAMLEHGTVYLSIPCEDDEIPSKYELNPYSKADFFADITYEEGHLYVTTNYRVLVENNWLDDLKFICRPTKYHEKRYTMRFTTDNGVMRELTRHRIFSFAVESTRYCNYSLNKFGNELTFIIPSWYNIPEGKILIKPTIPGESHAVRTFIDTDRFPTTEWKYDEDKQKGGYYSNDTFITGDYDDYKYSLLRSFELAEDYYFDLIAKGHTPQQARQVLPLATKCDVIMTGFESDWRYVLDLRLFEKTGKVHPDMLELTEKLQKEMIEAGIYEDIMKCQSKFE